MSVDKLKRVLWRVRSNKSVFKNKDGLPQCSRKNIERAIMIECGTSARTRYDNMKSLLFLDWIRVLNQYSFILTDKDLIEDF